MARYNSHTMCIQFGRVINNTSVRLIECTACVCGWLGWMMTLPGRQIKQAGGQGRVTSTSRVCLCVRQLHCHHLFVMQTWHFNVGAEFSWTHNVNKH